MTQIRIFEIEDEENDDDEYYTKRPKYASIIQEEDYEDEDEDQDTQPVPWDFREDNYFIIE
jgi:hypothetical protein